MPKFETTINNKQVLNINTWYRTGSYSSDSTSTSGVAMILLLFIFLNSTLLVPKQSGAF